MTDAAEMLTVQVRADEDSALADLIAERERTGQSRFDEWWNGVYRIVTGPSLDHGDVVVRLGALFLSSADDRGLRVSAPANIGVDKFDAKVPDVAVLRRDVTMTSPAFAATAELVVEVLSPREIAGEKLSFYAQVGVAEYLEIDLAERTVRLLARSGDDWNDVDTSRVLDFATDDVAALLPD